MVASAFRVLAVMIFAIHILFVVSGEATAEPECEDIQAWTIGNHAEWLDRLIASPVSYTFDRECKIAEECTPVNLNYKVQPDPVAWLSGKPQFSCRRCLLHAYKIHLGKQPKYKGCYVKQNWDVERFAEERIAPRPKIAPAPKPAVRPQQQGPIVPVLLNEAAP